MTEKKRQEITEVFKYLRGNTKKKAISNVSFDSYVSYLMSSIKDIPLHYQLKIDELKKNGTKADIISYLSTTLNCLVVFSEGNDYMVKGLKYLSKYNKRNSFYDFIENKQNVSAYLKSNYMINPYLLKIDLEVYGEEYKDLCMISKYSKENYICIFGSRELDFELALGLLSYLNF